MVDAIDWDKDGRMDLIVGTSDGRVLVFLNTGAKGRAEFGPAEEIKIPPIIEPRVIVADLDGDGDEDLFIPGTQGSSFLDRSFLEHGYAGGRIVAVEKRK
jgi:hypothetical protein